MHFNQKYDKMDSRRKVPYLFHLMFCDGPSFAALPVQGGRKKKGFEYGSKAVFRCKE